MPRTSETKEDGFQNVIFHCIIMLYVVSMLRRTWASVMN